MFRRYIRKLVSSLFAREVAETKTKETEIERQVNKLKQKCSG
jgi:predicted translin family RNA/ssDNA-binding protein